MRIAKGRHRVPLAITAVDLRRRDCARRTKGYVLGAPAAKRARWSEIRPFGVCPGPTAWSGTQDSTSALCKASAPDSSALTLVASGGLQPHDLCGALRQRAAAWAIYFGSAFMLGGVGGDPVRWQGESIGT
jgi:hypothetical protein